MQIQINSPHQPVTDAFSEFIHTSVHDVLGPVEARLTRVEIHLSDINGAKGGIDQRCLIEARPRGLDPLTAEHRGPKPNEAFRGALEKLYRVLEHRFGKLAKGRGN